MIEVARNLIPKNDDKAATGHDDIVLLFKQNILLVGQAFNSLAYQRWLNMLSKIIDKNTRVKIFLKEQTLEMELSCSKKKLLHFRK